MKYIYQLTLKNRKAAAIAYNSEEACKMVDFVDEADWSKSCVLRLATAHDCDTCRVLAVEAP